MINPKGLIMKIIKKIVVSSLFLFYFPFIVEAQEAPLEELEAVVVVSRHGVRAPTQSEKKLATLSRYPWPDWGVKRAYLTPRGYELVRQTWSFVAKEKSFIHTGCPNAQNIQVIADVDERTIRTAHALLDGLYPGCFIPIEVASEKSSALFSPLKAKVCEIKHPQHLAKKLTQKAYEIPIRFSSEIQELERITQISFKGNLTGKASKYKVGFEGKPYLASSVIGIFALEWGQWPGQLVAWNQVDETVLRRLMPLRVAVFSALNRDIEVAQYKGSALASKIIDSLEKGKKYTFLVGHDTNLSNLGALFDLNWQIPGRASNENAPGGYLKFEKWKVGNRSEIRISYSALSLQQIHAQQIHQGPIEVQILPPNTNFEQWSHRYRNRILTRCVSEQ